VAKKHCQYGSRHYCECRLVLVYIILLDAFAVCTFNATKNYLCSKIRTQIKIIYDKPKSVGHFTPWAFPPNPSHKPNPHANPNSNLNSGCVAQW